MPSMIKGDAMSDRLLKNGIAAFAIIFSPEAAEAQNIRIYQQKIDAAIICGTQDAQNRCSKLLSIWLCNILTSNCRWIRTIPTI
jgi:hypothetical protein